MNKFIYILIGLAVLAVGFMFIRKNSTPEQPQAQPQEATKPKSIVARVKKAVKKQAYKPKPKLFATKTKPTPTPNNPAVIVADYLRSNVISAKNKAVADRNWLYAHQNFIKGKVAISEIRKQYLLKYRSSLSNDIKKVLSYAVFNRYKNS